MVTRTTRIRKMRWLIGALAAAALLAPAAMARSSIALPDGLAVAGPAALSDGVRLGQMADGLRYTALADVYRRSIDTTSLQGLRTAGVLAQPDQQSSAAAQTAKALRPLPPIDAGSDQPNPLYVRGTPNSVTSTDTGSTLSAHDERVALPIAKPQPSASSSSSFDWGSAGIGAGITAFLAAVSALGAVLVVSRRRILHT